MNLSFEQFRAKLADVVTVAINSGRRVGHDDFCYCPLGSHPNIDKRRPAPIDCEAWLIPWRWACAFAHGFDGVPAYWALLNDERRALELGRLYRRRFGGKP